MQAKLFHHLRLGIVMISLLLIGQGSFAQKVSKELETQLSLFRGLQEAIPVEKVFLHLDKTQYGQGETIWIKSYLTAGSAHLPSTLSNTVYVELLSDKGELKDRLILRSEDGLAKANLKLDKTMAQGEYYLRAYTQWMKNQGSDFFFTKKIKVHSLDRSEIPAPGTREEPLELRFYPEGGHLVRHVASRLAFEVIGGTGETEEYSGSIFNAKNRKVASFSTSHEGRGLLNFVPKNGAGYYAKLDGLPVKFPLPDIHYSGAVLLVNNQEDEFLKVRVKNNNTNKDRYYLVAHTRGYITFASQIKLKGSRTYTQIDKSTLPEGITHLTLFDQKMRPLAERLVFIDQNKGLNIDVRSNKASYGARELMTVGFTVTDEKGKPVEGSFSLSAFDATAENDQLSHNIRTHLLLNSDLKGHIKNPSQYFAKTKEAAANLDLLMMVKGWSRFEWRDMPDYLDQEIYPIETGLTVRGRLTRTNGKDVTDGKVFLMNNATKAVSSPLSLTDKTGNFRFDNQIFYDTTQLVFQGFYKKGVKNVNMQMDTTLGNLPLNTYPSQRKGYNPINVDILKIRAQTYVTADSLFSRRNGYTDLGKVIVETAREGARDARISSFMNTTDFTDIPYEEKNRKDPYRIMIGRVPGLMFGATTGLTGNSDVTFMEPRFGLGERWRNPPLILIDGVESRFEDVYALPSTAINYVLTDKVTPPGLIAIYTLDTERYNELAPKPGLFVKNLPGYHTPDEFYAPRYEDDNEDQDLPDQRTTLFWSPMVTTDKNGEAMVNFYTPDQKTKVTIDVQGLSFKGNAGAGSLNFSIGENK